MFDSMKKNKGKMITLTATSSMIAAAAIHAAGLAGFFLVEGVEKTPSTSPGSASSAFSPT